MRKTMSLRTASILAGAACCLMAATDGAAAMGTFDLKDFGAVCDGAHDDTKAIQAWLNKLGEIGTSVAINHNGIWSINNN